MQKNNNVNQYAIVAKDAYDNILKNKLSFEEAWQRAAAKNIISFESQKKGCPKATFLGLCESGDFKKIPATGQCDTINYQYAKFAISAWEGNPAISKADMWKSIVEKFGRAKGHQGQLDVVQGLAECIK